MKAPADESLQSYQTKASANRVSRPLNTQRSASDKLRTHFPAFEDNRPEALAQRKLSDVIHNSLKTVAQKKVTELIRHSPSMVTQWDRLAWWSAEMRQTKPEANGEQQIRDETVSVQYEAKSEKKAPLQEKAESFGGSEADRLAFRFVKALPLNGTANVGGTQTSKRVNLIQQKRRTSVQAVTSPVAQLTQVVNVTRQQILVEDTKGGELGGKAFEWQSKFDVDVKGGQVIVTIRIKSPINPELFNKVWAKQVTDKWSNRFMIKAKGKNYPIKINLIQVSKGEHYKVTPKNVKSTFDPKSRGHFGTQSMTEWGTHDVFNVAHEVGHMLGNPDEYGKIQHEKGGKVFDYKSIPSQTIMAISQNNPVDKHYYLIKWAAEKEMVALGILSKEEKGTVLPDPGSRVRAPRRGVQGGLGKISLSDVLKGKSSLHSTVKVPSTSGTKQNIGEHKERVQLISNYIGTHKMSEGWNKWLQEHSWQETPALSKQACQSLKLKTKHEQRVERILNYFKTHKMSEKWKQWLKQNPWKETPALSEKAYLSLRLK